MGSVSVTSKTFNNVLFFAVFAALAMAALVSGFEFQVGGRMGWKIPTGKDPETYNEWAARNRFHIGDSVHFKYTNDSVLVVTSADYLSCNTLNPISKFDNGDTVFKFDRSGFFYFISGQPGNCGSGQRIIIRVMHPLEVEAPEISPAPAGAGGGSWNSDNSGLPESVSSGMKLSAVSYFMTIGSALLVIAYSFV